MKQFILVCSLLSCLSTYSQWKEVGKISTTATGTIGTGNFNNSFIYVSDGTQKLGIDPNQIFAGNELFFTSQNSFLAFSAKNVERMRILGNGSVGIGTQTPVGKFSVTSTGTIGDGNFNNSFVYISDGKQKLGIDPNQIYAGNEINFTSQNSFLAFSTNDVTRVKILNNGSVGIGTSTPVGKFSVTSTGTIGDGNFNNSFVYVSDGKQKLGIDPNQIYAGNEINFTSQNSFLAFSTNDVTRVKILNNGNVGIGTSTTGKHKLAVDGSIGAREINVETNDWSDFVFDEDYELKSIEEVEQYIKENGHLSEIPDQETVEKNGVNLGEMNAKLLQKIEELTLYTIEQNKAIEDLKKQNQTIEELKQMMELQNEKIAKLEEASR